MPNDGDRLVIRSGRRRLADKLIYCCSDFSRMKGLMGKSALSENEGVLIDLPESRKGKSGVSTSIHMLFVNTSISAAWLDARGVVKHAVQARPWRPYLASPYAAWYILELHEIHMPMLYRSAQISWKKWSSNQ